MTSATPPAIGLTEERVMQLRDSWLKEAAACQSHDLDDSFAAEHAVLCEHWLASNASRSQDSEPLRGLRPEEAKQVPKSVAKRIAAQKGEPYPPTDGVASKLLREIDEYLSGNLQNSIWSGSKLHQSVKRALSAGAK